MNSIDQLSPPQRQFILPLTAEAIAAELEAFHPALAGLPTTEISTQLKAHSTNVVITRALLDFQKQGVTRLAIHCDILQLNGCQAMAEAMGFAELIYVNDTRRGYHFSGRAGLGKAVSFSKLTEARPEALLVLREDKLALEPYQTWRVLHPQFNVKVLDLSERPSQYEGLLALDIARCLLAAKIDVVYIAEFAYFNLCRQSLALRKRGWRTALLVNQPASMNGNDDYFDQVCSTYRSLPVMFNVLRNLDAPIMHVQGWLTYHYLPLVAKVANPRGKVVTEFNDIPSLFGDRDFLESLFGPSRASLEKICEPLVFCSSDALIFNTSSAGVQKLTGAKKAPLETLSFHSYPERSFFDADPGRLAPTCAHPRLVFIGTVPPSSHPRQGFGDVQILSMVEELLAQGLQFDILLNPYQNRGDSTFDDYHYLERQDEKFHLRTGILPHELAQDLTQYDFGCMFYRFPEGFRVGRDHFKYMLPTKFFTFLEARLPILVSEELEHVSALVRKYGLGLVVSQEDLGRLAGLLRDLDTEQIRRNITAYRATILMDDKIGEMEALYQRLLNMTPTPD